MECLCVEASRELDYSVVMTCQLSYRVYSKYYNLFTSVSIYIETKMHQVLSDKILCHCLSNASRSIRRSAKIYCHVGRTETHVLICRVRFAPTKERNISLGTPCNWTWQLSIEKEFSSSEKNVLREKEKEYSREDKKKVQE